MMAYPQMSAGAQMGGMMGGAATTGTAQGGHVTANPTNALASNQTAPSGFGGMTGYGGFAMPMMLSPVFLAFGMPVVFQGSQAQPPVAQAPAAQEAPQVEVPPPVPDPVETAPVSVDSPTIDVVPTTEPGPSLPNLPIAQLNADDFASYKSIEKSKQQETTLSLELKTLDGDIISLNFSQLDSMQMSEFRGKTLEGGRVRDSGFTEQTDRVVNMSVDGSISAEEQAAIDEVLSTVISVVNSFFSGDMDQAVDKLKAMNFDLGELAELSLDMTMSKSAQVSRAYHDGGDHMHDLKARDADISRAIEFMASAQKRLIDVAKSVFDEPSAAKLVRSLVPPMLSEPFGELRQQIVAANESLPASADEADSSDTATAQADDESDEPGAS
jgi:hypothetical protein